ncbi:MAG: hypothetical protein H8E86_04850 [Planctomycetes bacterium]|nr:hypothetical protein [Planctomycetota bacterium]
MKRIFPILFLILTVTGCMDGLKVAPTIQELGATRDIAFLEEGRKIYVTSCTKCHNALRISRYSQQEWDGILPDMIQKTKLTRVQAKQVEAYINAVLLSPSAVAR